MICLVCGCSGHYHKIDSAQGMLPLTEAFSDKPFDSVAIRSLTDLSFGYRQPESRMTPTVAFSQDG